MTNPTTLNLNLATRPLRNRRLYKAAVRALAFLLIILAGLSTYVVMKYGGEVSRLKARSVGTRKLQDEVAREQRRLAADIRNEERLSQARVDLVNAIILRKTFRWTTLLTELEKALPGPSFITTLSPGFTASGGVSMRMRVMSRSLDDLLAFVNALGARGFKDIQVYGETRSPGGRLLTEISLTYERAL